MDGSEASTTTTIIDNHMDIDKFNFFVAVRLRPDNLEELRRGAIPVITEVTDTTLCVKGMHSTSVVADRQGQEPEAAVQHFAFDKVFRDDATQVDVTALIISKVVPQVLRGVSASVMAYGTTGSGKTFTMFGSSSTALDGVIPLSIASLLSQSSSKGRVSLFLSMYEIYCERVHDLLQTQLTSLTQPTQTLLVREGADGEVQVEGLTEHQVNSPAQAQRLLGQGAKARAQHSTVYNCRSSRSHAVIRIRVVQESVASSSSSSPSPSPSPTAAHSHQHMPIITHEATRTTSCLTLVDLAGSEKYVAEETGLVGERDREEDTQTQSTQPLSEAQRRRESQNINRSLLSLKQCLACLSMRSQEERRREKREKREKEEEKEKRSKTPLPPPLHTSQHTSQNSHIPFRNSKLTLVLRDSLRTGFNVLIATVIQSVLPPIFPPSPVSTISINTPSPLPFPFTRSRDEILNTLRYAQTARSIVTSSRRHVEAMVRHVDEYRAEVAALRARLGAAEEEQERLRALLVGCVGGKRDSGKGSELQTENSTGRDNKPTASPPSTPSTTKLQPLDTTAKEEAIETLDASLLELQRWVEKEIKLRSTQDRLVQQIAAIQQTKQLLFFSSGGGGGDGEGRTEMEKDKRKGKVKREEKEKSEADAVQLKLLVLQLAKVEAEINLSRGEGRRGEERDRILGGPAQALLKLLPFLSISPSPFSPISHSPYFPLLTQHEEALALCLAAIQDIIVWLAGLLPSVISPSPTLSLDSSPNTNTNTADTMNITDILSSLQTSLRASCPMVKADGVLRLCDLAKWLANQLEALDHGSGGEITERLRAKERDKHKFRVLALPAISTLPSDRFSQVSPHSSLQPRIRSKSATTAMTTSLSSKTPSKMARAVPPLSSHAGGVSKPLRAVGAGILGIKRGTGGTGDPQTTATTSTARQHKDREKEKERLRAKLFVPSPSSSPTTTTTTRNQGQIRGILSSNYDMDGRLVCRSLSSGATQYQQQQQKTKAPGFPSTTAYSVHKRSQAMPKLVGLVGTRGARIDFSPVVLASHTSPVTSGSTTRGLSCESYNTGEGDETPSMSMDSVLSNPQPYTHTHLYQHARPHTDTHVYNHQPTDHSDNLVDTGTTGDLVICHPSLFPTDSSFTTSTNANTNTNRTRTTANTTTYTNNTGNSEADRLTSTQILDTLESGSMIKQRRGGTVLEEDKDKDREATKRGKLPAKGPSRPHEDKQKELKELKDAEIKRLEDEIDRKIRQRRMEKERRERDKERPFGAAPTTGSTSTTKTRSTKTTATAITTGPTGESLTQEPFLALSEDLYSAIRKRFERGSAVCPPQLPPPSSHIAKLRSLKEIILYDPGRTDPVACYGPTLCYGEVVARRAGKTSKTSPDSAGSQHTAKNPFADLEMNSWDSDDERMIIETGGGRPGSATKMRRSSSRTLNTGGSSSVSKRPTSRLSSSTSNSTTVSRCGSQRGSRVSSPSVGVRARSGVRATSPRNINTAVVLGMANSSGR